MKLSLKAVMLISLTALSACKVNLEKEPPVAQVEEAIERLLFDPYSYRTVDTPSTTAFVWAGLFTVAIVDLTDQCSRYDYLDGLSANTEISELPGFKQYLFTNPDQAVSFWRTIDGNEDETGNQTIQTVGKALGYEDLLSTTGIEECDFLDRVTRKYPITKKMIAPVE